MYRLKQTALALGVALAATALVTSPLTGSLALAGPGHGPEAHAPKPPKPKDAAKLAGALCVAAMGAGAFEGRDALELADYCVELAVALTSADYSPPEPESDPELDDE